MKAVSIIRDAGRGPNMRFVQHFLTYSRCFIQGLVIATVAPDGITIDYFADSSSDSNSSDESSDPELQPQDKWSCLRCKQKNQPIPRYCQHCFAVRKQWFPPRPKGHKKRQESNLESITIPPQIQITPNLSIPDLSEMKGHPIADSIERSFNESVSRFASMSDEQRLDQLKETVQRNKLVQAHSEMQVAEMLKEKVMKELKSAVFASSKIETVHKLATKDVQNVKREGKTSCLRNRKPVAKARSSSSDSSIKTIKKDRQRVAVVKPASSVLDIEELDFQSKVSAYLASCNSPVLDTPPTSQENEFLLDPPFVNPEKSSQPSECDTNFSEDVVDGIRPRVVPDSTDRKPPKPSEDATDEPKHPVEDGKPFSFSTISGSGIKMCSFCEVKEANTAFIHARKGHLCACYACAKQVYAAKGQCPICQRQASSVCKIYS